MVVIAIVGILFAVDVPAYKDHVYCSNVSYGISFADPYIKKLMEYYAFNGEFPCVQEVFETLDDTFWSTTCGNRGSTMNITDPNGVVYALEYAGSSNLSWPSRTMFQVRFLTMLLEAMEVAITEELAGY